MHNKYRYLLIDGNNLFWRIFTISLKKYILNEEFEIVLGSLIEALHAIKRLQTKYGDSNSEVYILFDNPDSVLNMRKLIDENYKSIRMQKNAPKGLYKSLSIFIQLCKIYDDSWKIVQIDSLEADDLTDPLIKYLTPTTETQCLCISNDLDWARNISHDSHWYNWAKIYDIDEFIKEKGYSPEKKRLQLYKTLRGDSSDNIPCLLKAKKGEKEELENLILYLLRNYANLQDMYVGIVNNPNITDYWKKKLFDIKHEAYKNDMLVDFMSIEGDIHDEIIHAKRNISLLRMWYDSLGLSYESFMHKKEDSFFKKSNYSIVDVN